MPPKKKAIRRRNDQGQQTRQPPSASQRPAPLTSRPLGQNVGDFNPFTAEPECVACFEPGDLIRPCLCTDAMYWHYECLCLWICMERDKACPNCNTVYTDRRITRINHEHTMDFLRENMITTIMFILNNIGLVFSGGAHFFAEDFAPELASFGIGFYPFIIWFLMISYVMSTRYRAWVRSNQIIYLYEFNGRHYERGIVYVYNLTMNINALEQAQIRRETALIQGAEWREQLRTAAKEAGFQPDVNPEPAPPQTHDGTDIEEPD